MDRDAKILVVGHGDVIERSLVSRLSADGYTKVAVISEMALETTLQAPVYEFFQDIRPEYVFLGSTRSGGIQANQDHPGEFIYHNLETQNNIIYAARKFGVKKLLYMAASCVYPKDCPQPMIEDYLLTGPLEPTSEAYSIAKIAGIKLCQAYRRQYGFNVIVAVPATVYGPDSDTDFEKAHVMGALAGKFLAAVRNKEKKVTVWGTGEARREFMFADDFAEACFFLMKKYEDEAMINVGTGSDVSIKELAGMIASAAGFTGEIAFDATKPDGAKRKLLDNSRIAKLGWKVKTNLQQGIEKTISEMLNVKRER